MSWSPDGLTLASALDDGTVRTVEVWDRDFDAIGSLVREGRMPELLQAGLQFFGYELQEFELMAVERPLRLLARNGYRSRGSLRPSGSDPIAWLIETMEADRGR